MLTRRSGKACHPLVHVQKNAVLKSRRVMLIDEC